MNTNELLTLIQLDIADLKKIIPITPFPKSVTDKWVPRGEVMKFFGYGNTQMASLEKNPVIYVSKIGRRTFFLRESIEKLLDKNVINIKE